MPKDLYKVLLGIMLVLLTGGVAFARAQEEKPLPATDGSSRYVLYSKAAFDAAADKTRVYFFHAGWCPTCRALDAEINANLDEIPGDVIIFKTDYDSNGALKSRYGVTYQHTLVVVDAQGEVLRKWTGGDLANVLAQIQEAKS